VRAIFEQLHLTGMDNTIIVFIDKRLSCEHGLFGKQNRYELGGMPCDSSSPAPAFQRQERGLVYLMDLFPTFAIPSAACRRIEGEVAPITRAGARALPRSLHGLRQLPTPSAISAGSYPLPL